MNFLHRTWVEVDINALRHNFSAIKSINPKTPIMAVVKANAYGHSVKDIAPVLQDIGADSFAVSNLEEALQLRDYGITRPILILGYTPPEMAKEISDNDITQAVYSTEFAKALNQNAVKNNVKIKIHIKLDTGMGRIGFDCRNDDLNGISEILSALQLPAFKYEGIFTHFAVADSFDNSCVAFTNEQYSRFNKAVDQIEKAGYKAKYIHTCNSAASTKDVDKHRDYIRPGIILYGLKPDSELTLPIELIPVMTFKSVISMVKTICVGDTVSYGRTFTADRPIRVATVTAGYADGYPRLLSNKARVMVRGKYANIIGRVCMDQFMIDVSNIDDVSEGDEVILFGKDLLVDELADAANTINYEIICGISPRVPRIIKKGDM